MKQLVKVSQAQCIIGMTAIGYVSKIAVFSKIGLLTCFLKRTVGDIFQSDFVIPA